MKDKTERNWSKIVVILILLLAALVFLLQGFINQDIDLISQSLLLGVIAMGVFKNSRFFSIVLFGMLLVPILAKSAVNPRPMRAGI